jgi:hypothetical protein
MALIGPTDREFALFVSPVREELRKYDDPEYKPKLFLFKRNLARLREPPVAAHRPTTTLRRTEAAYKNIQEMYTTVDTDLYILCTSILPLTKFASLNKAWIDRLKQWWISTSKPPRLGDVVSKLCEEFKLPRIPQQSETPNATGAVTEVARLDTQNAEPVAAQYQIPDESARDNAFVPPKQTICIYPRRVLQL